MVILIAIDGREISDKHYCLSFPQVTFFLHSLAISVNHRFLLVFPSSDNSIHLVIASYFVTPLVPKKRIEDSLFESDNSFQPKANLCRHRYGCVDVFTTFHDTCSIRLINSAVYLTPDGEIGA